MKRKCYLSRIHVIFVLITLHLCTAERRIVHGKEVSSTHNYVVYLSKASASPQSYDFWLCGGAIVSPTHIVTSAACIKDVGHMYAIAGYRKYITQDNIKRDHCTKEAKRKIVYSCTPKPYKLVYENVEQWATVDIAVVIVEYPYDFSSKPSACSWVPHKIEINYDDKWTFPGVDVFVLGWGHVKKWRQPEDTNDYNSLNLRYASTVIINKTECKEQYSAIPELLPTIDKYMICTQGSGTLDETGHLIPAYTRVPTAVSCDPSLANLRGGSCGVQKLNEDVESDSDEREGHKKSGICQNDHGGPLVTWMGGHAILIGVASVFRITPENTCTGPYLFTSTQCNGAFMYCTVEGSMAPKTQRFKCDEPPEKRGYDIIERRISWKNHPDGPAANELDFDIILRPQKPINSYG